MADAVTTSGFQNTHPTYAVGLIAWKRARAILEGEESAKKHDAVIDTVNYNNLLIPFSPRMDQQQYNFYRAEAELPGISSQFLKMLLGALLKTAPEVTLPKSAPPEADDWIKNQFGQDNSSFQLFLKDCIEEELTTSRAWVYVDRPYDKDPENPGADNQRPFPTLWKAEEIINFQEGLDKDGYKALTRIVIKRSKEVPSSDDPFTTKVLPVYVSHELDPVSKFYQVVMYEQAAEKGDFIRTVNDTIRYNNEPLKFIPAWPLNGKIEVQNPMLMTFINKEVALYNKISRRNHLLYGAATYTPYIASDMDDGRFKEIVDGGLGTWFRVDVNDKVGILQAPTEALQDMDRAISASMDEIARLGIRLLTPEVAQSGIALEIRNAAQSSQIGFLAELVNILFSKIIAFMLNWRYNLGVKEEDIIVRVNASLMRQSATVQWAELVTSWYEAKLIPRSLWLSIVKSSELFPAEYDDKVGRKEINDVETNLVDEPDNTGLDKILSDIKRD